VWLFVLLTLTGCAAGKGRVVNSLFYKDYKRIVVLGIEGPDAVIAGKTAERFVRKFERKGFTVIERSKLKKIAGEDILTRTTLKDEDRPLLENDGVRAFVVGSISTYECQKKKIWTWTGFAPEKDVTYTCQAALQLRMVDVRTGEVLWEAVKSHKETAEEMTARMALEIVIGKMDEELPRVRE